MIYKAFSKGFTGRHAAVLAAAACALALGGLGPIGNASAAPAAPARSPPAHDGSQGSSGSGKPALWRTYDMIVNLHDLPRTYTCDQLWYEFHGILLQLGAWPYSISILPYHCSPSPSGSLRSPDVEARFQLPIFVHGAAVKWAPAKAIERTVRLSPGEPKTLLSSDCQLLHQIEQTLLASIPVHIDEEHFDCSAASRRAASFNVRVSLPMAVKMPTLAATSAAAPH